MKVASATSNIPKMVENINEELRLTGVTQTTQYLAQIINELNPMQLEAEKLALALHTLQQENIELANLMEEINTQNKSYFQHNSEM